MTEDIKNVFISHVHEDDEGLSKLKDLVKKQGLTLKDSSITSDKPNNARNPDYIMNQILKPRIDWCSVLVVYVTPDTKDSTWVEKEIEYANQQGKRIVGVWEQGSNQCEPPDALDKYADAMVGWNGESIIDAINGNSNAWYGKEGNLREYRPISRHKC